MLLQYDGLDWRDLNPDDFYAQNLRVERRVAAQALLPLVVNDVEMEKEVEFFKLREKLITYHAEARRRREVEWVNQQQSLYFTLNSNG